MSDLRPAIYGMSAYLAGPMSGKPKSNFPAFHRAAAKLRDASWKIINPAEEDEKDGIIWEIAQSVKPGSRIWCNRLVLDVGHIYTVDALIVLPGWTRSCGARIEVAVAKGRGIPILKYPSMEPIGV